MCAPSLQTATNPHSAGIVKRNFDKRELKKQDLHKHHFIPQKSTVIGPPINRVKLFNEVFNFNEGFVLPSTEDKLECLTGLSE